MHYLNGIRTERTDNDQNIARLNRTGVLLQGHGGWCFGSYHMLSVLFVSSVYLHVNRKRRTSLLSARS